MVLTTKTTGRVLLPSVLHNNVLSYTSKNKSASTEKTKTPGDIPHGPSSYNLSYSKLYYSSQKRLV